MGPRIITTTSTQLMKQSQPSVKTPTGRSNITQLKKGRGESIICLLFQIARSAKQRRSTLALLRPSVFTFLYLGIAGGNIVIHLFSLKVQLPRVQIFYQITHVSSDFLQCRGIDSWLIFQGHVGFRQGTSKGAGEKKEGLQGFTISNESTLIPRYEARLRDRTWKQVNPLCVSLGYLKQPCH